MNNDMRKVRRAKYWRRTFRNKLYAVGMLIAGAIPAIIYGEGTLLAFMSIIALPLFFARRNWIA